MDVSHRLQQMTRSRRRMVSLVLLFALLTGSATSGAVLLIGKQAEGWFLIPTNQTLRSAGNVTLLDQRPVDMALRPDGAQLAVMTTNLTYLLNPTTGEITQQFDKQDRNVAGLAYSPDGARLYYAKGKDHKIGVVSLDADGKATFVGDIDTGAKTWPSGLSVSPDGATLYVALFGTNQMGIVDLAEKKVRTTLPTGSSPFGAYVSPDGKAVYTSNWGGPLPQAGDAIDPLFPVKIDPKTGASAAGSLSVYDVATNAMRPDIAVGLHPTAMVFSKESSRLYVANSNDDTISVLDLTAGAANAEIERISVRPTGLPFGSMPNGLALSPDGTMLYVANGGNNAIAVVALDARARMPGTYSGALANAPPTSAVTGFIPTEWYPIAVAVTANGAKLAIANNKGEGSLATPQRAIPNGGKSVFSLTGSVTMVDVPNAEQLAAYTAQFDENNRYAASLADSLLPPRADAAPVPVPVRIGEPSVFAHVLYIIKENRTYDQMLGDMGKGNSEPKLAQFPRRVSPNHHALADRFGLLDNYYASSVNSADGHQWTDEAVANVFAERVYGFFPTNSAIPGVTSYGNDSLDLPPDSLWSNALNHNVSLRNYGEDGLNNVKQDGQDVPIQSLDWAAMYKDWQDKTGHFAYIANAITPPLLSTEDRAYPAFETAITDQIRADEWLREFNGYVEMGNLPQLSVIWLPDDHTSGTKSGAPTPEAQVADNDLALGRIVDAVSHSPYWANTAIFVTEDDAQNGVDHVDGHRTVGFGISAYNQQGIVDSTLYNQTSMVRTIEQILGLPPMNQFDLTAPLMTTLFTGTPDLTPYTVMPNQVPLDTLNGQADSLTGQGQDDARVSDTLDFSVPDATDPTVLNPIIWRATMGDRPYPHFTWEKRGARSDDD
ncbi:MAG: alkaline phosphatase family protein [Thermomicrobiales bacterium]